MKICIIGPSGSLGSSLCKEMSKYKHNDYGTLVVRDSLIKKVSNLVAVSSVKAVRSSNIMAATKKFAELWVQGIYLMIKKTNINSTKVRFGNVFESSVAIIPKFKK